MTKFAVCSHTIGFNPDSIFKTDSFSDALTELVSRMQRDSALNPERYADILEGIAANYAELESELEQCNFEIGARVYFIAECE